MILNRNVGFLLLGIGLIVWGILTILGIGVPGIVLGLWMIVTGVFILIGR